MKKYRVSNSTISLIITIIAVFIGVIKNDLETSYSNALDVSNKVFALQIDEYNVKEDIISFVESNINIFSFYADTFAITIDNIINSLELDNQFNIFNYKDIGNTGIEYNNLDKNIIDYLFNLEKRKPKLFNKSVIANTNSKEYIYKLLNYYTNLYGNVDYQTLASIAYIESGNLNSKYMLSRNNIFGGMSSSGLISYRNISYGVLIYVKMMSINYYAKGLTTLETIGKKYNPIEVNGVKIANPKWVSNINSISYKFSNEEKNVDLNSILSLK